MRCFSVSVKRKLFLKLFPWRISLVGEGFPGIPILKIEPPLIYMMPLFITLLYAIVYCLKNILELMTYLPFLICRLFPLDE